MDVDAGNSLVENIKPFVRKTRRSGADAEIGGFGGVFDLKATGYHDPVLVSGTDGVGTKLAIALATGIHDFVGTSFLRMVPYVFRSITYPSLALLDFASVNRCRPRRHVCE